MGQNTKSEVLYKYLQNIRAHTDIFSTCFKVRVIQKPAAGQTCLHISSVPALDLFLTDLSVPHPSFHLHSGCLEAIGDSRL